MKSVITVNKKIKNITHQKSQERKQTEVFYHINTLEYHAFTYVKQLSIHIFTKLKVNRNSSLISDHPALNVSLQLQVNN